MDETHRLAAICEASSDAILAMTLDGIITDWNKGAGDLYGYSAEETLGRSVSLVIPASRYEELERLLKTIREGKRIEHYETIRVRKDGSTINVSTTASPIFNDEGNIIGISWISRDITRQIQAKKALRESEEKYRAIFEHSAVGIGRVRPDGTYIEVNQKMCDITGYTRDELLGKTFMSITHPDDLDWSQDMVAQLLAGETDSYMIEKWYIRKDSSVRFVNLTVSLIRSPNGEPEYLIPVVSDITECKRAEEGVRMQADLIDLSPDAIIVRLPDGTITFWSRGAESLYGWTKNEALGQQMQRLLNVRFPKPFEKLLEELQQTGFWTGELVHTTRDKREIVVQSCWRARLEKRGKIREIMESNVDITERKRWEVELADARAQSEFYMDLISHDINNMNQIAMGFLEMGLESFSLNKEERELLEKPLDTIRNSSRLIDHVRKLKHVSEGSLKMHAIDLCNILSGVKAEYSDIPGRKVTIDFTPVPLCYIVANELIKDVFSNLIGNAVKHSDPQKPLTISIRIEQVTEEEKTYYKVLVEDNGPGIPDDLKKNLFTRFERSKTKASGKGLGLFLVRTLVEDFRGRVWVEDRVPGDYSKGARFIVMVPAADAAEN